MQLRHWLNAKLIVIRRILVGLLDRAAQTAAEPPDLLRLAVTPRASVVIPALNEARRIGDVVRYALSDPACAEVIVVDDSSIDDTVALAKAAGAKVITSTMLGKGASMEDGYRIAQHAIVAYLDGDLAGLSPNIISKLVTPIATGNSDMVKAAFGRGGGRVTELTAKPMLKLFFPELVRFSQPLGGIVAARKDLLSTLQFETGYGVDVGLLIDAHTRGARIAEVDIGSLEHESQPLANLALMAQEVSRVILDRAREAGRLSVDHILSVFEIERQNQTDIDAVLTKLQQTKKVLLLDMDGTVTPSRFIVELARSTGRTSELERLLTIDDSGARSQEIAALFRFVHKSDFERVARDLVLREGVVDAVNHFRRCGYKVGVISDSYFVATDIVRRRIFADFAISHSMEFDRGICVGKVRINRAFVRAVGCDTHPICKSNALRYVRASVGREHLEHVVAVGDNENDVCLLELADAGFTIDPKHPALLRNQCIVELNDFSALARHARTDATRSTVNT